MAITLVGSASSSTNTVNIPAHQAGDFIIIFAFNSVSTSVPPLVTNWTNGANGSANTCAGRMAYRIATASGTVAGTWTNADRMLCLVYRSPNGISFGTAAGNNGTGTSVTLTTLTLTSPSKSRIVSVVGHRTAASLTNPAGLTKLTQTAATAPMAAAWDTAETFPATYSGKVSTASASSGFRVSSMEIVENPDTTPPAIPANLSVTAVTDTSVTLQWSAAADALSYRLMRDGVAVTGATSLATTSFTDTGLTPGSSYSYTISAVDAAGNRSGESPSVSGQTSQPADTAPPTAPTLSASVVSARAINLSWPPSTDSQGYVSSYTIYQNGVAVQSLNAGINTVQVMGLAPQTSYTFQITATDNSGNESDRSFPLDMTTLAQSQNTFKIGAISYVYPDWWNAGGGLWSIYTGNVPTVDWAIINPSSGPGIEVNTDYLEQVNRNTAAGLTTLGYVPTGYFTSGKTMQQMTDEIDLYYAFYGAAGLDGIFFDEVSTDPSMIIQYRALSNHVKRKSGTRRLVVTNPGTAQPEGYMADADIICTFEGLESTYRTRVPAAHEANYPPDRFVHILHGVPEVNLSDLLGLMKTNRAGYVYVTDNISENTYGTIPVYMQSEINQVAQATIPQGIVRELWNGTQLVSVVRDIWNGTALARMTLGG